MSRAARLLGIGRSLAMYYGMPWRARRMRALYGTFLGPGALAFDIGAHVGNRIRCFRALGATVVAVEPQPDCVRVLEALYGRDPGVTLVPAAAGPAPGKAVLHVSERTPTVSTVSSDWMRRVGRADGFRGVRWPRSLEVAMITLDALIERHGRPAFVKIDVEGYEREALDGLTTPVPALSFEYLPAARDTALACIERLGAIGEYRYAFSHGESHRLGPCGWCDADRARRFLEALAPDAGSGDVYARLAED